MPHSRLELLKLQQLRPDFSKQSRLFMTEMAVRYLEGSPAPELAAYSAVIVESLFRFGLLSLADQVARKRHNEQLLPTSFDRLAMSYKNLANYDIAPTAIASHYPLHPPESGRRRLRALSFLYTTPAFQQNGYVVRTASILANTAIDVFPVARIGYPWTAGFLRDNRKSLTTVVNGIAYHHRRGELPHQNDVMGNLALAKLEIRRIIAEIRPDVVHAASNFTVGLPALFAARECRLPFVYEMRGIWELTAGVGIDGWEDSERFHLERKMETFLARHADRTITLTETQKLETTNRGIDASRIHVVPNFFDGKHESEAPTGLIDELRTRIAGRRVVGYVGSIVNYEGLQDLLAAMSAEGALEDVVLLIIGGGPYFDELKALAATSSARERVILTGRVPRGDAEAAYDLIDLCVLPRLDHPVAQLVSPLKLIEILAHGKVLLVSDVQAMVELVRKTGYGETFKSGAIDDLRAKLIGILANIDGLKDHYASAAAHILEHYTWKQGVKLWDRTLERAVEDWRTSQKTEIVPPLAADATRTLLPAMMTTKRIGNRLMVRVGHVTLVGSKIGKVLLTTPDLEDGPQAVLFDVKTHRGTAMTIERDAKSDGIPRWRVGAWGDGERLLYLYAPANEFDTDQARRWTLTTSRGKPLPITFEANRILALEIDQRVGREENLVCVSGYPESVRFAMSVIPLQGSETLPLFDKQIFSAIIGARFRYVRIEPAETAIPVNSGVKGRVMIELTAWQDGYRGQQSRIKAIDFEYRSEQPQSWYIDLPRNRHNVLVVARLNENLIDGSVIWLKTLVNSLAADPGVNVFVLTNSILIPNSINSSLFRKPNVTKVDLYLPAEKLEQAMAEATILFDRTSGGFDTIIVRGTGVAREMPNRSIRARTIFYAVGMITPANVDNGICRDREALHLLEGHAGLIFQSAATLDVFRRSRPGYAGKCYIIPPSVDTDELDEARKAGPVEGRRHIVYAGKAIREYGVLELLEAILELRRSKANGDLRLIFLGSKFDGNDPAFQSEFHRKVEALGEDGILWIPAASPVEVLSWVNRASVVWGWRHGEFENAHFEVSTKMIEAICLNAPVVLYPSDANLALLGVDYPGFAETSVSAGDVIVSLLQNSAGARARLRAFDDRFHSMKSYAPLIREMGLPVRRRGVLIASHDFRFIEDIEACLQRDGHHVHRQVWRNHFDVVDRGELAALDDIDIIHCEWCLGNAVWWSNNLPPGKTLTIRLHLQEIFTEHPGKVDFGKVHKVIFISANIMRRAIETFGIPADICEVVPISVSLQPRSYSEAEILARRNVLGMVGITPWRKRPDLTLELFRRLKKRHCDLTLVIKGNMPSDYSWMKQRPDEILKYQAFFRDAGAERDITFLPYDDDMQEFYEKAGWVMSVSDFEGCHTAVAEGGMLGCLPLMLNWGGADEVYPAQYVQRDLDGLEAAFDDWHERFAQESSTIRDTFVREFAIEKVYARWATIMGLSLSGDQVLRMVAP